MAFELDMQTKDNPPHRLPRRFETLDELLGVMVKLVNIIYRKDVERDGISLYIRVVE